MVTIEISKDEFDEFLRVLELRMMKWGGLPDIQGSNNSLPSQSVGLLAELGVRNWLLGEQVSAEWTGENDDAEPDLRVDGIGIEVKAQQPHNWTPKFATTVQKRSLVNWRKKPDNQFVIWTVCSLPSKVYDRNTVEIRGWNRIDEVEASGEFELCGTRQFRSYPNLNPPEDLLQELRS